MDRNEILANFQACTSIDDIAECMTVLEEHDWDLQTAVSATLAREHSVHPISNGSQFQFNHHHAFTEPVMQTYRCQLGELSKEITLDDSSTVGDLKEIASIQLGIPLSEMQFERWPRESSLSNPSDSTVLSTLHLPRYNILQVKLHSTLPGVTVGLDAADQTPFDIPCPAWKAADISADVNDLMREFTLEITNKDTNKTHSITCEGVKTVQELRQDVIPMTGISYRNQRWSGFPGSNPPDDNCTIASLKLNHPRHSLSVQSKIPVHNPSNNHTTIPFMFESTASHTPSIDRDSLSDDDYEDALLDDDLTFGGPSSKSTVHTQLMPDEVEDVKGALSQFQVEFSNRYGIGPHFEADTLQNTMQKAFGTEARKRKLLAVYIHHDQSIQSNVFCSQLLCADSIVSYLNEQFVCWAWDITSDKNRNRLLQECTQFLGTGVSDSIRRMKRDEFPLLVLAQGKGRTCDVTAIMQGNTELNELMAKLLKAVDDADVQKAQDIRDEDARNARERIKQEQEEAYRRSLEQDRAKMMKEAEEAKRIQEEEKKRQEAEHKQQQEATRLMNLLPEEPDIKCGKPLMQLDRTKSLQDNKFHPQEALIIEEAEEE